MRLFLLFIARRLFLDCSIEDIFFSCPRGFCETLSSLSLSNKKFNIRYKRKTNSSKIICAGFLKR